MSAGQPSARVRARALELSPEGAILADFTDAWWQRHNPTGEPRCDFCNAGLRRRWIEFGCASFTRVLHADRPVILDLEGVWAACRKCAPLVNQQAWRRLANRVLAVRSKDLAWLPASGRSVFHAELCAMWMQAAGHFTGEREQVAA